MRGSNDESGVTSGTDRKCETPGMGMTGILCWSPKGIDTESFDFTEKLLSLLRRDSGSGKGRTVSGVLYA